MIVHNIRKNLSVHLFVLLAFERFCEEESDESTKIIKVDLQPLELQ